LIFFCLHFFSYAKDPNQPITIAYNYTYQVPSNHNYTSFSEPFQVKAPFKIGSGLHKATIKKATEIYLQAGNCFFQADIHVLKKIIMKAVKDNTITTPLFRSNLQYQAIDHLVKTHQIDAGKVRPYKNHPWMQQHDLQNISQTDQINLNYLVARLSQQSDYLVVEYAQAGLDYWQKAQLAQNLQEKNFFENKYKQSVQALKKTIIAQPCSSIDDSMQNSLRMYHKKIEQFQTDSDYKNKIKKRVASAEKTLQNHARSSTNYVRCLSDKALGFLYVNNLNYAVFENKNCYDFQHTLTKEIIDIINSCGAFASDYSNQFNAVACMKHVCNLAIAGQQFNLLQDFEKALPLIDLAYFFTVSGQPLLAHMYKNYDINQISLGVLDGTLQALDGWKHFVENVYEQPVQTVRKIIDDCYDVADVLYQVAATIAVQPYLYLDDVTRDMQDFLGKLPNKDDPLPDRMIKRTENYIENINHGVTLLAQTGYDVMHSLMQKSVQENVAQVTEFAIDSLITAKATESIVALAQFFGSSFLQTGGKLKQLLPFDMQESSVSYLQTSSGNIMTVVDTTGESIHALTSSLVQAASETIPPLFAFASQAKLLTDKIKKITKPDPIAVEKFQKEIEPFLRTDKIINVDKLRSMTDIDQVKNFIDYTNNFTDLSKLKPEEILYLNLCNWLEPQARSINAEIKAMGGWKIIDPETGAKVIIEKLDLFHSLLGEMKPGSIRNHTKGGHLLIPELRSAKLEIDNMKVFNKIFLDTEIKYLGKISDTCKPHSYFPLGTSVQEAVCMIKNGIENSKLIAIASNVKDSRLKGFVLTNDNKQKFQILIKAGEAQFYPLTQ
ncbi:MAG: hypothetical protein ACXWL2_05290, partial [Candidatus Chromulinivorax sp.]